MATPSRVGTPTNLSQDGTHDILLFSFQDGFPNGRIRLSFGTSPRRITGLQKVAQTFAKVLMTPRGSDPIRPEFGTDFYAFSTGSNVGSNAAVTQAVLRTAIAEAAAQTKNILRGGSDLDSQLQSAVLVGYQTKDDATSLYVKILTIAGEQASVAIPFPQTDLVINA
jgi:hypothetical protein